VSRARSLALAVAVGAQLWGPSRAAAQTCTAPSPGTCVAPSSASLTIGKVMQFQLSAAGTTAPTPTYADYVQGYNETTGPTITVRANTPWTLSVSAGTALWSAQSTGSATPRPDKPAADLQWSQTSGSGYVGLTTAGVTVATGTATAGTTIPLYYRILYALDLDTPGRYSLDVVVTVVTP
jgi:hypothetical protein